jgi:hypothetical protein
LLREPRDFITIRGKDGRELATKTNAVHFLGLQICEQTDRLFRKHKIFLPAEPRNPRRPYCDAERVRDLYEKFRGPERKPPLLRGRPAMWLFELIEQIQRLHGREEYTTNRNVWWITKGCRHLGGKKLKAGRERGGRRKYYVDKAQAELILDCIAKQIAAPPKPPKVKFNGVFEGVAPNRRMSTALAAREFDIRYGKIHEWITEGALKAEWREVPGWTRPTLSVLEPDVLALKDRPRRKPFRFGGIHGGVAPNRRVNLLVASRISGVSKDSLVKRVRNGTLKSEMRMRPDLRRKEYTVLEADVLYLAAHNPPLKRRKRRPKN